MYLKSTHTCLLDGNHQWEVTLFCSAEANTIKSVDIVPKSRGAKVVPNDAKPAPTAYTMIYTTSSTVKSDNHIPYQFSATITFLKSNEKKTVSVPANMATDRKRRKADFNDNNNGQFDQSNSNHDIEGEVEDVSPPPPPPKDEKIKRSWKCFNCLGTVSQRKKKTGENMDEKGEIDDGVMKKRCCVIM